MIVRCLLALLVAWALTSCASHDYGVEGRETPVHVWLTVPELAAQGGQIDALIYIGPYKAVQGPVQFRAGSPTVNLTTLFIRAGSYDCAAVLDNGRLNVRERFDISGECWVQVVLKGGRLSLTFDDRQPDPLAR
ncbi:MAG: hypothetical protein O2894_05555 [Planctomycetota bacterium]|nr:hypothetical protein [Planctomycetota bacterium]